MGLLCTLQLLALRSLVACPSIPLFSCRSRDAATFFLAARVSDFRKFVSHSTRDCGGGGQGFPDPGRKLRKNQSFTSAAAFLKCGFISGSPVTAAEDDYVKINASTEQSRKSTTTGLIDLSDDDDEHRDFPPALLLNRGKERGEEKQGFGLGRGLSFRASHAQEKHELRSRTVRSIFGSISSLRDVTLVAAVLNEWLKKFASSIANSSRKRGDYESSTVAGSRFVPYTQVARIVHCVMQDLGRNGQFEFALEVLRWMEGQGWCKLDPHMYTTIISALGDAGSFELAETIFEELESTQVVKDPALLNAMLNTRGKAGHIDSLEDLFESMKNNSPCKPDLVTYNTVMNSYVKAGIGLGTVVDVFREMYSHGIHPDVVSFDILLQACISGRHVKEAQKIFGNLKKRGLKPSVVTYTTLITLYADSGHCKEAIQVFSEMLKEGCQPNTRTFSSLITACGRVGFIDEAERLFQTMKRGGVEPNVVTYNAMIDMYGKGGDREMVLQKYRDLELAGLTPTGVTFSSIMSSLKAAEAYEEALVFYDRAKLLGVCNEHVYSEAIDAFIKWGKVENVKSVQSDMVAAKCNPNVVTCSIVLAALGSKCSSAEDAAALVNFLRGFESNLPVNACRMLLQQMNTDSEVQDSIQRLFVPLSREEPQTWTIFTCGLVDALWAFGWRRRSAQVVGWGMERGLFGTIFFTKTREWKLDLRRLSRGSAIVALYQWLGSLVIMARGLKEPKAMGVIENRISLNTSNNGPHNGVEGQLSGDIHKRVPETLEVLFPLPPLLTKSMASREMQTVARLAFPPLLTIVTGWGKLSKQPGSSPVQKLVQNEILKLGAPFELSMDSGRWMTTGEILVPWLTNSAIAEQLVLSDKGAEGHAVEESAFK